MSFPTLIVNRAAVSNAISEFLQETSGVDDEEFSRKFMILQRLLSNPGYTVK